MTVPRNFYDDVGGAPVFHKIVARFYEEVRADPCCARSTRRRTSGPPRSGCGCSWSSTGAARARTPTSAATPGCGCGTSRSRIGPIERDAWLRCMRIAVDEAGLAPAHRDQLWSTWSTPRRAWSTRRSEPSSGPGRMPPCSGGGTPSSTRSTCPASPTPTATASATWRAIRSRLGYLELLGVDALWLSPIYPSPMVDHGYDVTDHRGVDPVWGDLDAVRRPGRRRARARHPGDRRPRAQPHLGPARVVPRRAGVADRAARSGPATTSGRAGATDGARAAQRLAQRVRRPGLDPRAGPRDDGPAASGTCTCSPPPSPT